MVTESQNSQSWKGTLEATCSNPPAHAWSPRAGCPSRLYAPKQQGLRKEKVLKNHVPILVTQLLHLPRNIKPIFSKLCFKANYLYDWEMK